MLGKADQESRESIEGHRQLCWNISVKGICSLILGDTYKATSDAATLALCMMQPIPACQCPYLLSEAKHVGCRTATTKPTPEAAIHDITMSRAIAKQAERSMLWRPRRIKCQRAMS